MNNQGSQISNNYPIAASGSETLTLGKLKIRYGYICQGGSQVDNEGKQVNKDSFCHVNNLGGSRDDAFFGVFDGHGKHGAAAAQDAATKIPEFLKRELLKTRRSTRGDLSNEQTYEACNVAYKTCSRILEKQKSIGEEPPYKYSHSGTTAISVYIQSKQKRLFISNVGDSRAVLARDKESNLGKENTAIPLSWDQTPYRGSERRRIREAGARILSMDQVLGISPTADDDGTKEIHDYRDLIEGEEEESDLRVWDKENDEPGVTHTRSIGDSIAKRLGVIAEPEMVILDLETDNEIVVLASDGIFEFLTNQSVIDICVNRKDEGPLKACEEVIEKSRKYWVEYENFVDDMTMICLFISQL